mgnify:CR=1 FL=1
MELGFRRVAILPAAPLSHAPHLDRWLEEGFHGEMLWMEGHRDLRTDPSRLEPGTRSVIALSAAYGPPRGDDDGTMGGISRYARGDDYHDVLRAKLRALSAFISAEGGVDVAGRPAIDSAPLLERNLAVEGGLGWLGKSAMVLHPDDGSYFFLAELLVPLELVPQGSALPDRCGRCTRCIDLCPTGAIVAPYRVDARRCISYLTIEVRGPIPRAMRPSVGLHLFGCDICQQVCPWNTHARAEAMPELAPRPEIAQSSARDLLVLDGPAFAARFRGSPIKRTKRRGLARNAAVVLGNLGDRGDLPLLTARLNAEEDPLVRGHIAWAIGRQRCAAARIALEGQLRVEESAYVQDELRFALTLSAGPG